MELNINTDAVVKFTNQLERLTRSALPVAIRGALNNAAFDVKTNTMLKSSEKKFINRQKNFFRANSRVDMAKGFDINTMAATVGFVSTGLKGGSNFSVKNLEQQENGGGIGGRSFIAMDTARASNSAVKNVRPANRLSGIKKIVSAREQKGANARQKLLVASKVAGVGGYIKNDNTLFRVASVNKLTPLYSFKRGRNIRVKSTKFMSSASIQSGRKIEDYFIAQAKKQIAKL